MRICIRVLLTISLCHLISGEDFDKEDIKTQWVPMVEATRIFWRDKDQVSWFTGVQWLDDVMMFITTEYFEFQVPNSLGIGVTYVAIAWIPNLEQYFFYVYSEKENDPNTLQRTHFVSKFDRNPEIIKTAAMAYIEFYGDELIQGKFDTNIQKGVFRLDPGETFAGPNGKLKDTMAKVFALIGMPLQITEIQIDPDFFKPNKSLFDPTLAF